MSLQIIPYQPQWEQALLDILQLNVPTYFAQKEVEDLRDYLQKDIDLYYVVLFDTQIIGAGGVNRTPQTRTAVLSWGFLHPQYHHKGIGTALVNFRIAILENDPTIDTISVRTSQVVYPFFEKKGFRIQKIQKNYWADGFDLYEMLYLK